MLCIFGLSVDTLMIPSEYVTKESTAAPVLSPEVEVSILRSAAIDMEVVVLLNHDLIGCFGAEGKRIVFLD